MSEKSHTYTFTASTKTQTYVKNILVFVLFFYFVSGHIYFYDTEGAEDGVFQPEYQLNVDELAKHANEVNPPDEFANFYFFETSFVEFIRGCQPVER